MYDPATTDRFLDAQMEATPSFKAERHSLSDIDAMIEVLADAYDPPLGTTKQGRQLRRLSPDELAFIENERLLCTHDARYYYTRYARVIDAYSRRLVRFNLNIAQEIVLDVWAEMEANRWAIMMLQLKARRLGVSTLSEIEVARRLQFWPETAAVVASSTPDKSSALTKIIRDNYDHMPWWLMPRVTEITDGLPTEFREHNASLSVQAGNQFSGLARGATPSCIHLSEVCEFENPEEDIDSSLLKAILENPEVFFILESTALGRDNWYHRSWRIAKEGWPKGTSKLYPMFLPWYVGRDIYPMEAWLATKHPVPVDWKPDDQIVRHAERARDYVLANPRLKKFMGDDWVMPKEQMWYYHVSRDEDTQKGILNRFLAEMCSDDLDAFQSTNTSAFRTEVIQSCRERIRSPQGVYKLIGLRGSEETIPEEHRPDSTEIDTSKPRINIPCQWGPFHGDYQLVPVTFEGYSTGAAMGRIFIYEHPKPDYVYGLGVDTAEGIGLDRTTLQGVRKDTLSEPDVQVCELASPFINGIEFWPWCMALGSYYSPPVRGEVHQAKMSIEVRTSGDALQYELRKRGWINFLVWPRVLDSKRIDMSKANKLGFVTNAWSRPNMLNMVLTWINRDRILINSPYFIEEMESFEKDEDRQAMRAVYGAHDDRIMALGFILFAFHIHEIHGNKITLADQREAQNAEADPVYDPGFQGRDIAGRGMPTSNWELIHKLYPDKTVRY